MMGIIMSSVKACQLGFLNDNLVFSGKLTNALAAY